MKVTLSILLSFFCLSCFAQSIAIDRMETDGRHQIMTSTKEFSFKGVKYGIGLKIFENANDVQWLLLVSSFNCISDDTVILLKLNNGQTIPLPVNNVHTGSAASRGYVVNVGNIGFITPGSQKTFYAAVFDLYQSDLDSIDAHGIAKMRIGNDVKYSDKEWKNNSLGKYITKCRKAIIKRLQKNPSNTKRNGSIYDNF